jgi:copper ion binding protein
MTTTTRTFTVDGMTCGGCVRSVTNAVSHMSGVSRVDVSLEQKAATVEFDAAAVAPAAIVAAIEAAGFGARVA